MENRRNISNEESFDALFEAAKVDCLMGVRSLRIEPLPSSPSDLRQFGSISCVVCCGNETVDEISDVIEKAINEVFKAHQYIDGPDE